MIIRSEDIKECCSKILTAVDNGSDQEITEALELVAIDTDLYMNVTNREYFVSVRMPIGSKESFKAAVNANLFLKLISQITTETIEFNVEGNSLVVVGNGRYTLPLIYDGDEVLSLPRIDIVNKTLEFNIDHTILNSILFYNSKELLSGCFSKPVQKMYYIDEKGAITFTKGACVNNFTLEKPVKFLLTDKIVKLFKLFKSDDVFFTMGHDAYGDGIQSKVQFKTDMVTLTVILNGDDSLITSVPVTAIRDRANSVYPYSVILNKNEITQALNRLMLFYGSTKEEPYSYFVFEDNMITLYDMKKVNSEEIYIMNESSGVKGKYEAVIDIKDLKYVLDSCKDEFITILFGDETAFVIKRNDVINVVPEASDKDE